MRIRLFLVICFSSWVTIPAFQGFLFSKTSPICWSTPFSCRGCSTRCGAVSSGADIEQPTEEEEGVVLVANSQTDASAFGPTYSSGISVSSRRGKVNEINFCMAPADASLSRAYGGTFPGSPKQKSSTGSTVTTTTIGGTTTTTTTTATATTNSAATTATAAPVLSLTRALNNASNRAVRRILLARSWPSAEALNLSLRRVVEAERQATLRQQEAAASAAANLPDEEPAPKCPVPRPILNVLTRKRDNVEEGAKPRPRGRTDAEYVTDQMNAFRERYGSLPGYGYAEAYLDSILSLATTGIESVRVPEVMESGVYDDAYRRIKAVLRTVGAVFVEDQETGRFRIAKRLIDQDICLSLLDKISIQREAETTKPENENNATQTAVDPISDNNSNNTATATEIQQQELPPQEEEEEPKPAISRKLRFWKKQAPQQQEVEKPEENSSEEKDESASLSREDLGGVLLSAEEPTMTRQLNVLSNIALRALLFGGSQELLVLAETLDADRVAFVERWYAHTGGLVPVEEERRPGVQFLNCLVTLLRNCYNNGVVTNLQPPLPLVQSYANSYERLVATAVELGSGCLKPAMADVMAMPTPRTATEELGRFAVWETNFRAKSNQALAHPEDLQGKWEVRDVISGETIGVSTVELCEDGQVKLAEPLEGLRWRCDPGPTHLDTCTFQVLASDGTILQYRGFVDRGARLEARVSKRPISVRGSVMFQMRDGSIDYFKDMLPINYREGTTNFVMTKFVDRQ
ncbi:hypothetical protein ACA910_016878 [Epithemia clementina (nom. ined.)]